MVVQRLHQPRDLPTRLLVHIHAGLGDLADLGVGDGDAFGLQGRLHGCKRGRVGGDDEQAAVAVDVLGACVEGDFEQFVLVDAGGLDGDLAFALEQERDVAGAAQFAAAAVEDLADFAAGAVAVVGHDVDQ